MCSGIDNMLLGTARRDYEAMTSRQLLELIVYEADLPALHEFHARPFFHSASGKYVVFAEYVDILRKSALGGGIGRGRETILVDAIFDLLTDRFVSLPLRMVSEEYGASGVEAKTGESHIDCRNYFRGLLAVLSRVPVSSAETTPISIEMHTVSVIQSYVNKQFWYCLKEAIRNRNPLISRYTWNVKGHKFTLWFPRTVRGAQRRAFLEDNVGAPGSDDPLECEQIQALIDGRFGIPGTLAFDEANGVGMRMEVNDYRMDALCFDNLDGVCPHEFIAAEKAAMIDRQRPAIRSLGPAKLRQLVLVVLESAANPRTSDATIAARFGISKATFSRFAGRDWRRSRMPDDSSGVPDLYRNISHLMGRTPRFIDAAKKAGIWEELDRIRQEDAGPRPRSVDDGK